MKPIDKPEILSPLQTLGVCFAHFQTSENYYKDPDMKFENFLETYFDAYG